MKKETVGDLAGIALFLYMLLDSPRFTSTVTAGVIGGMALAIHNGEAGAEQPLLIAGIWFAFWLIGGIYYLIRGDECDDFGHAVKIFFAHWLVWPLTVVYGFCWLCVRLSPAYKR